MPGLRAIIRASHDPPLMRRDAGHPCHGEVSEDRITAFVDVMRPIVLTGDTPFRRAYLRPVIDNVEVDDAEIPVHGRRTVLERLMTGAGATPTGVPGFVREWRTREDSNL